MEISKISHDLHNLQQRIAHTPGLGVQSPLQSKMKWNFGVFHSRSRKYLELNPLSNPKLHGVLECSTHGVALRNALSSKSNAAE